MKEKPTKFKIVTTIIRLTVMTAICVATMVCMNLWLSYMYSGKGAEQILNFGWDLKFNGGLYSGVDLRSFSFGDTKRGDTVELTCTIPSYVTEDSILMVRVHYYDVRVFIDEEEIFTADCDRYERGETLGNGFYTIHIGDSAGGKQLKMIFRAGEKNAFSSLESPEIWNADTFFQDYAALNIYYLALSFFFVVVGMAMIVMALAQEIRRTFSFADTVRFSSLALLALAFGIWIFTGSNLSEIFTSDLIEKVEINYYSFYLLPIFFIGFHFETGRFKDPKGIRKARIRNSFYGLAWLFGVAFFCYVWYQHIFYNVGLRSFITVAHIYDVIVVAMLVIIRVYDLIKGVNVHMISAYATIMTGVAALVDLLRYNYYARLSPRGSAGFTMSALYFVMIVFVLSLFFDYMSDTVRGAREEERVGLISKLAYTDALTGLNNRQATERYFDDIDASDDQYIVVEFDLNSLKAANDTYGHEEGDKYIQLFAETLKHIFEGKGYISRTGGDEFVYVMKPKAEGDRKWIEGKLRDLNAILSNKDTGHSGLKMSTAYGSYDSFDGDARNIRDGLRIADARMYEMKKKMKESR